MCVREWRLRDAGDGQWGLGVVIGDWIGHWTLNIEE